MSSAGAGIPDLQEEDVIAKGLKELEIGKKLEKFEEVKATGNVYLIMYREICEEVREYRRKENRLRRAIWLAETVSLDQIEGPNGQLILNIEEARQTIANRMKNIILLFKQAAELEVTVEDDLSPDYEWVRTMAEVNPEELEEQFEKAKMKVEVAKGFVQLLKVAWESDKASMQGSFDIANENVERLFDI